MRDVRVENAPPRGGVARAIFDVVPPPGFDRAPPIPRRRRPPAGNATRDAAGVCAPPRAPRPRKTAGSRRARLPARRGARTPSRRRMCFFLFFFLPPALGASRSTSATVPSPHAPRRAGVCACVGARAHAQVATQCTNGGSSFATGSYVSPPRRSRLLPRRQSAKLGRSARGVRRGGELVHAPAPDRGGFVSIPTHTRVQAAAHHLEACARAATRHGRGPAGQRS